MLNKIMLIGNLGRDPELSYTPSGKAIAKFSLAVSRRRRDESGEQREETQWFNIVAWERLAETCNNYLKKGSKVYIEGRMTSRKYTDKDGVERTVWDVVASEMEMLTPKGGDSSGGGSGYSDEMGADDVPF
ncbi:MAG TPA: single-stranded DNA-binding protein [Ktedonobacterales bacterium]|nr:single-stranded DNA-binding protein [Ktedonobacterales bacterium]